MSATAPQIGNIPIDPCCYETLTCFTNPYDYSKHLKNVDAFSIILGICLILGTIISVLPQIIKLFKKKQVQGISFIMLVLAAFNLWTMVQSYLVAEFSQLMACANTVTCLSNLISLFQSTISFFSQQVVTIQYLYYEYLEFGWKSKEFQKHFWQFVGFVCYFIASFPATLIPGVRAGSCNTTLKVFSSIYMFTAAIIAAFEWIPQIVETYRLKGSGSFSIVAMCIQCPGCAISLIVTITTGNPWYTWISWIVSFSLESILLYLLIFYELKNRKEKQGNFTKLTSPKKSDIIQEALIQNNDTI